MSESLHIVCPHCHKVNRVPAARLSARPMCGQCREPLFTGHPVNLHVTEFEIHAHRSGIPLVVDFWAPWCGPCRIMAPAFEEAARQLEPKVRLARINTEEEQELARRFGISSIPTLAIFLNGRETARQAGAMHARGIVRWVSERL